jgi:murein DD-endopeptidase MepM/ murein hydrolase activator NlpD
MQVGQEVKLGDPIGSVGATAIFESAEPTHLHFELYKENKLVDPAAYIDLAKE